MVNADSLAWQHSDIIMNVKLRYSSGSPKVFLVEDETMLAMLMEVMLEELGYSTAFHASTLEDGMEYARTGSFDLAIWTSTSSEGTHFQSPRP